MARGGNLAQWAAVSSSAAIYGVGATAKFWPFLRHYTCKDNTLIVQSNNEKQLHKIYTPNELLSLKRRDMSFVK